MALNASKQTILTRSSKTTAPSSNPVQYVLVNPQSSAHNTIPFAKIIKTEEGQDSKQAAAVRREALIRQPSYCKILDDLKDTEDTMAKGQQPKAPQQSQPIQVSAGNETIINLQGQAFQIVAPANLQTLATVSTAHGGDGVVQYAAATSQNGQTVFIPAPVAAVASGESANSAGQLIAVAGGGSTTSVVTTSPSTGTATGSATNAPTSASNGTNASEEAVKKREMRLLKNREAARECRIKKKEYIKCLENRVAVLENQNKALIEELKSLKELYAGQHKNS